MPTNDDLWYILRDVQFLAGKYRFTNRKACDFYHLGIDAQIEHFNNEILPMYEAMGMPQPLTPEYYGFQLALFVEEQK